MSNEKLPLKSKLAYGGLGAGIGLPSQIVYATITFFYNTILRLNAELIGITWLIFSVWNHDGILVHPLYIFDYRCSDDVFLSFRWPSMA